MLSQLKDTLTCDSSLLHQFQSDEAYNYARELEAPDSSLFEWILQQISRFLDDVFSIKSDGDVRILLYILVALTLLGVVGYLLWRYKPALFRTEGRSSKMLSRRTTSTALTLRRSLIRPGDSMITIGVCVSSICRRFAGWPIIIA